MVEEMVANQRDDCEDALWQFSDEEQNNDGEEHARGTTVLSVAARLLPTTLVPKPHSFLVCFMHRRH